MKIARIFPNVENKFNLIHNCTKGTKNKICMKLILKDEIVFVLMKFGKSAH